MCWACTKACCQCALVVAKRGGRAATAPGNARSGLRRGLRRAVMSRVPRGRTWKHGRRARHVRREGGVAVLVSRWGVIHRYLLGRCTRA